MIRGRTGEYEPSSESPSSTADSSWTSCHVLYFHVLVVVSFASWRGVYSNDAKFLEVRG